ncbi:MAG: hypothetical protein AABW89_03665 [Nanoarchaeota archaeon]
MKILYTNISPITNAYTNINHLFYLKKQNPQKVYLCVWDNYVFENNILDQHDENSKKETLENNVKLLQKVMDHLNINYRIIYLSEMWHRLFRNPKTSKIYQKILSLINLEQISKGFSINYTPFGEISLSKLNYIIIDYLISIYLQEIAPEICNSQPTHYLTSERFKVFKRDIDHVLKLNSFYSPPAPLFVTNVPVIMHQKQKIIPSMGMSVETIKQIIDSNYGGKLPERKEIEDLVELLSKVNSKIELNEKLNYKQFIEFLATEFYSYFDRINDLATKIEIKNQKKSMFVSRHEEFNKQIKPLNKIKLQILKLCDGENTSLDIANKSGIKLSTVSTYLTHLKNKGLLNEGKKPKRTVDNIIINLELMGD